MTDPVLPLSSSLKALRDEWWGEAKDEDSRLIARTIFQDCADALDSYLLRCEELEQQQARVDALEAALRGLTDWVDDSPDVYAAGLISAARAALAASAERRQTEKQEEDQSRIDSTRLTPTPDATAGQNEALRTFARECLAGYVDGSVGDLDGGWLQDKALELGMLMESGTDDDPLYYVADWLSPLVGEASNGDAVPSSPERKTE
jgi:hypothetical protein